MKTKGKILLVEDDTSLGYVIKDSLTDRGFDVTWEQDGELGWRQFTSTHFDLCLFDVMMPRKDGFALASNIRATQSDVPILFITAKGHQDDKLEGFKIGGDDYIVKPFNMDELIFRMSVFLKRANGSQRSTRFIVGDLTFSYDELSIVVHGSEQRLTQKEADLLKLFFENQNSILKRTTILNEIWGDEDYFVGRSLDVFISKIRKYIGAEAKVQIKNYHGVGFKLEIQK